MDTLFFYLAKIFWQLIKPETIILILLSCGLLLLYFKRLHTAKLLLTACTLLLLLIAFLPVGEWLSHPLESRIYNPPLPEQVDGIIVLGGALNPRETYYTKQSQLNGAAERLTTFVQLAKQYPNAQLIFTGGSGEITNQNFKEADQALQFMMNMGVLEQRIIFERESRNTWENATNSSSLFSTSEGERWILITSAEHMPRSIGVFCKQGKNMIPHSVDYNTMSKDLLRINLNLASNLGTLNKAMREWTGLLAYYLTGKTGNLLPSECTEN